VGDEPQSVIPIESDADVVTARQRAREMAGALELTSTDQTLLATAISEVARNITTYAGRGEVLLSVIRDDKGRYTSGGGLGLGLPGARRLVDDFHIETAPGQGTTVTLLMWARSNSRAA
jgi:serine/threonine-protein kinase RsbT